MPLAAARDALTPANEIVYMRIRSGSGKFASVSEQWAAQDPRRWRLVYEYPRGTRVRDSDGPIRGRVETGYAAGRQSTYFVERNTMRVLKDLPDDGPHARLPGLIGQGGGDPQADLRAMLAAGKLKDTGEVQAGGRTVRRLVSDSESRDIRRIVTYDVDPVTFAPVQVSYRIIGPPRPEATEVRLHRRALRAPADHARDREAADDQDEREDQGHRPHRAAVPRPDQARSAAVNWPAYGPRPVRFAAPARAANASASSIS